MQMPATNCQRRRRKVRIEININHCPCGRLRAFLWPKNARRKSPEETHRGSSSQRPSRQATWSPGYRPQRPSASSQQENAHSVNHSSPDAPSKHPVSTRGHCQASVKDNRAQPNPDRTQDDALSMPCQLWFSDQDHLKGQTPSKQGQHQRPGKPLWQVEENVAHGANEGRCDKHYPPSSGHNGLNHGAFGV